MRLRDILLRRTPDFPEKGRITCVEKTADLMGINRWFLRRPPISIHAPDDQILSPAQAKVQTLAPIGPDGWIEEKKILGRQRRFRLVDILKDENLAATFLGGDFLKLYLAPWDLHFLLFPAPGRVTSYAYHTGWAFPLLFMSSGDVLNERLSAVIETDWEFPLVMVMIGSWMVNGIHHSFKPGQRNPAGGDFGHFKVGSSVVLVAPPGRINWTCCEGDKLDLGTSLGNVRG